jgi:hypothetical protein
MICNYVTAPRPSAREEIGPWLNLFDDPCSKYLIGIVPLSHIFSWSSTPFRYTLQIVESVYVTFHVHCPPVLKCCNFLHGNFPHNNICGPRIPTAWTIDAVQQKYWPVVWNAKRFVCCFVIPLSLHQYDGTLWVSERYNRK